MRITFVIGSLSAGGAEKVLVLLTKALVAQGYSISVVTLRVKENDFFELSEKIERTTLDISTRFQMLRKFPRLRWAILSTKPDLVVSFIEMMNIMTVLSMWGSGLPVVVSERSDPNELQLSSFLKHTRPIWNALRGWSYRYAAWIIVQNSGALNHFLPKFKNKITVIPNPVLDPHPVVDPTTIVKTPNPLFQKPMILSVGRLHEVKRFDRLIRAFSQLKEKYPDWELTILGDGPLRNDLAILGRQLRLGKRFHLPGFVKEPFEWLRQADLFVLTSRVEGFPNALCEAMASGLAVISTDCPSGPREIIRDGIDGILVENGNNVALVEAMDRLMSNGDERKRFSKRSIEVVNRFNLENIVKMWESTFSQALSGAEGAGCLRKRTVNEDG